MLKLISVVIFFVATLSALAVEDESSVAVRQRTWAWISAHESPVGIRTLRAQLKDGVSSSSRLKSDQLTPLMVIADCIQLMKRMPPAKIDRRTLQWILESNDRLHSVVDVISEHDSLSNCFGILTQLANHDVQGRDEWFDLMLALSVVWDHSKRYRMHGQMGKRPLKYTPDILRRYDYFKALYSGSDAKMPYDELDAASLVYVVHTPVPLTELEWARNNLSGERGDWGEKYSSIVYDSYRLTVSEYQWPNGDYTLEKIKQLGGICVDQAYYAVMTARAFGIPAIYFSGKGTSAGHAWFAFMDEPGKWELGVGRYKDGAYTVGRSRNPQTNTWMTDHEIEYLYAQLEKAERVDQAKAYASFADVLIDESSIALACVRRAHQLAPLYKEAWDWELTVLMRESRYRDLIRLFEEQQTVFKKYPDIILETLARIEPVLLEAGLRSDVDAMRRTLSRNTDDERDDLTRSLEWQEIAELIEAGKAKSARRKIEKLLEERIEEGAKIFDWIRQYLKFTKEFDQVNHSVRFLEGFIDEMIEKNEFSPGYTKTVLNFLATACENAGDERGLEEVRERIAPYEH